MALFEKKEEYLEKIRNQIRCKKARDMVADELEQHIEDQKAAYLAYGDDEPEAMKKALEQMGDPVMVGKQLDKLHQPRLEWRLVFMILILCTLGLMIQFSIHLAYEDAHLPIRLDLERQQLFIILGIIIMGITYYVDYSFLGRHAKLIWVILLIGSMLYTQVGIRVNGGIAYLPAILMLFIPLYGGIVYTYRKGGYAGMIKCLLFAVVTMLFESGLIAQANVYLGFILSCNIILTVAIYKNWFGVSKRLPLLCVWGWPIPVFILNTFTGEWLFQAYQTDRIRNLFHTFLELHKTDQGYQMGLVRQFIGSAKFFGESETLAMGYLPNLYSDYILTYVIAKFGIAAGILLILMLLVLFGRMLQISWKQKNSLGMFVGIGCSLVFITLGVNYMIANLGFQILAQVNLPFVSYGGASMLINFVVMGFLLSVFRNTNIMKETPYRSSYRIKIEKLR